MFRRIADSIVPKPSQADRDRIARLLVVLTASSALRLWRDQLGSSVEEAADDVDWVVRAANRLGYSEEPMMNATATRSTTTRRLGDLRMADVAEVGGKAASLGELLAAGVRVPDGVVIAAGRSRHDVGRTTRGCPAPGRGTSAAGRSRSARAGSPRMASNARSPACTSRCSTCPADDVPAAVDRCLASASAARVAEYEAAGGGRMAVIVQRMVAAGRGRCGSHRRSDQRRPEHLRRDRGPRSRASGWCPAKHRATSGSLVNVAPQLAVSPSTPSIATRPSRSPPRRVASRLPAGRRRTSSGRSTATARSGSSRPGR